jgi:hypothetical protein
MTMKAKSMITMAVPTAIPHKGVVSDDANFWDRVKASPSIFWDEEKNTIFTIPSIP